MRLAQTGNMKSETLDSRLINRLSCCCHLCTESDLIDAGRHLLDLDIPDIIDILDGRLFGEIADSFFASKVMSAYNRILIDIVSVIKSDIDTEYPQNKIIDELKCILESDLTDFYSVQKTAYMFRELASIFSSCKLSAAKSLQFNRLNTTITNTISLFISNQLYNTIYENKMMGWSSIYITRDTLTYGEDLGKTYTSILHKLQGLNYEGAYIYTYDDPVRITDTGSWIVPKSVFLQAFFNPNNCQVLFGESRRVPSVEILTTNIHTMTSVLHPS